MENLFAALNAVLSFVTPVSDFFWDFPKMFSFWKNIPLLGSFSLAIIVLVGSGIYFTIRLGFIQVRLFSVGVHTLASRRSIKAGISPLAAFLLSTAMRVGPGNMIGVTGAIAADQGDDFPVIDIDIDALQTLDHAVKDLQFPGVKHNWLLPDKRK